VEWGDLVGGGAIVHIMSG